MIPSVAVRVVAVILLIVIFGVVVHTPLTVLLSTYYPDQALFIKSWKELLMGVALVLLVFDIHQKGRLLEFLRDRLLQLILAYATLHVLLALLIPNRPEAIWAGVLIDLRYILFFALAYLTVRLWPGFRMLFLKVLFGGAAVVFGFALLQMFVLPKDFLSLLGYGPDTIAPYMTVDENPEYIRINSTLRGPNPLGAYAVIMFSLVVAAALKFGDRLKRDQHIIIGLSLAIAMLMLIVSYSRSALAGLLIAALIIAIMSMKTAHRKKLITILPAIILVCVAVFTLARTNPTISHIIWHDDPNGGGKVDSNTEHARSLVDGFSRMVSQPFGGGVGSTGSASLLSDEPLIIENHYLFVAHEVGWLGLIIFMAIFLEIMRRVWVRRTSALALGVFASGWGLAAIGILLPVWADDTVSIVWWGLAGIVIGGVYRRHARKNN